MKANSVWVWVEIQTPIPAETLQPRGNRRCKNEGEPISSENVPSPSPSASCLPPQARHASIPWDAATNHTNSFKTPGVPSMAKGPGPEREYRWVLLGPHSKPGGAGGVPRWAPSGWSVRR